MRYTVVWTAAAEGRFTQLWLASRMRHSIKDAADQIDAALALNPSECGESRNANRRAMFVWPVGVLFEIDDSQRQVKVVSVWQY
jgi:plasmid stabilization system protein ParE